LTLEGASGSSDPAAQNFRHTPCLRDASAWNEWVVGIENFADRSDAGIAQMRRKSGKKTARPAVVIRIHPQPRIDKRPD
jgi:hypothetical protein